MSNVKRSPRSIIAIVLSVAVIAASVWVFLNRQYVADMVSVWTFRPSADIAAIQERAEMTDAGRFAFYATHPTLLNAEQFNLECPRQEVGSSILGCYTGSDRIFIYNLTDEQLDGMEEVTATHEMLHAVWQRMNTAERQRIGNLLNDAFRSTSSQVLQERMAYYQRTEPTELTNELHSILGTEVVSLGDELEAYYAQYFNRQKVLALFDTYNSFYTDLREQADTLYQDMQALSDSIDTRVTAYTQEVAALSNDINSFNRRATAGSFTSQYQFSSERAALVRRSNQLEADRTAINNDIATYNDNHQKYEAIAQQIQLLYDSMDSYHRLDEAPSI